MASELFLDFTFDIFPTLNFIAPASCSIWKNGTRKEAKFGGGRVDTEKIGK